jgi:fructose-bisphosphate aldolase class I
MDKQQLASTAQALVAPGKGILAADESSKTIQQRFDSIGLEATEQNRRSYRELLFRTAGMEDFISGVILYDETIRQSAADGTPLPQVLSGRGIIPGIKSDSGLVDLTGFPGEKVTSGLDGLAQRLADWGRLGARFSKWRATIAIGEGIPTAVCLRANAQALARNAALSQEAGIVPIVEPEVLMAGDHSIERCEEATEAILNVMYSELIEHRVYLEGSLLKPNMVLAGQACSQQASVEQVAEATIRCFKRTVPAAVPGIVFLSGGQGPEEATQHLNAMNALGNSPWQLSFSYGRALLEPALNAWAGDSANAAAAQKAFHHRARCNGAARSGAYTRAMESVVA